ncbi:MAG: pseudouridine synthase, partial [Thermoguttaceae bacterium]
GTTSTRQAGSSIFTPPNAKASAKKKTTPAASNAKKTRVVSTDSAHNGASRPLFTKHRLQKILAVAGFGSRRACEELITTGRVEVDRHVVTKLGTCVDPTSCEIRVDGQALRKSRPVYIALYKPKGFLCTHQDPKGRRRVIDLVPESFGRLFSVGRLDLNSEGLIILTNDGALAERLTHPRFEVPKVYRVQVSGTVERKTIEQLKKGIYFAEGFAKAEDVEVKGYHKLSTFLEITLREGKNREIRRLMANVGHKVMTLLRYSIGPIKIGKMLPGDYRVLTHREVSALYTVADKHFE